MASLSIEMAVLRASRMELPFSNEIQSKLLKGGYVWDYIGENEIETEFM